MLYGVVGGFLALTRKCFVKDGASLHTIKEKETVGWKSRKREQQHKGDYCYGYPIRKEDCTYPERGKSARTNLKELKGVSFPFSPFIYSVSLSPCRKHLADSSVPRSPWFIPSMVCSTRHLQHQFPLFALLTGNVGYTFISKVCSVMGLSAHFCSGVGTGWGVWQTQRLD